MIFKNISKTKLSLALISLAITFFVWQQGFRDSLSRPSVSFDISQKEQEIVELAVQSIPTNLKSFIVTNDPVDQINNALSEVSFNQLTERNKLIWIISSESNASLNDKNISKEYKNKNYNLLIDELEKKSKNNAYKPNSDKFDLFKGDRFLYHLLSKKFDFDDSSLITKSFSSKMFFKILAIRLIPLLTILLGSILALQILWKVISSKKFVWKEIDPLELELIDMVLLIAGGFVVLGEVVSPLFSISLVEFFSKNISSELSQSLKIFFGYVFMAIPPLAIVYYQIKSLNGEFIFKKDYFQFNFFPIKDAIIQGIKGWLTIVPFVLLISLIMNSLIENQNGSNPLLEIVLNNNSYLSFIILFVTTTLLAPLFEEIIFRGILLPTLSRDFGIILAIIFSAFIFALAHLSLGEMPPLFVLGMGLGITRIASGSLLSSIIMHSLWNGLTFLNLFLLRT
ncbi:CPBP family intramembrane metalloprotease domain-containing protein [Prochlorococcus marinus str. MU1402]|uniref:CPBP family intramembrane glutamic endopeptidase n=1 Tax=Prochlorococcus marinus TaxID=1219 RepID=UPI001ADBAAC9|nr:CPBP family intramembrane glutamic endopeptidase [Prochlorococcus marinus]MBO8231572.1 CPBP family intramembrane metalloprotease [Prochlorococcus marinus XMU1402]MBW3056331.1 CPBP family intramembrane metalloprotease domain-containing protein [Prochlorococcus marinus str. MU1402]